MKPSDPHFVVCVKNTDYPASLELRKLYQVVSDRAAAKHHQIRVIDEPGEDYLYPEEYFAPLLSTANSATAKRPKMPAGFRNMAFANSDDDLVAHTLASQCSMPIEEWGIRQEVGDELACLFRSLDQAEFF
jgi:hypothetical protein